MFANRVSWAFWLGAMLPALAWGENPPSSASVLDTGRHVYHDVEVLRIRNGNLVFRHSRGLSSLPLAQLPSQVRARLEGKPEDVEKQGSASPKEPAESENSPSDASPAHPDSEPRTDPVPPPAPLTGPVPEPAPISRPIATAQPPFPQPVAKGPVLAPVALKRVWIFYPIRRHHPSPLGTGTYRGHRGLPLNWYHVHPAVYPQSLANPEWRRLAELDFRITSARNNPALLTRHVVTGW